jgi:hypothetical protein
MNLTDAKTSFEELDLEKIFFLFLIPFILRIDALSKIFLSTPLKDKYFL